MKNVDRIAKQVIKNGVNNMLIHSIPGTPNWIIAEKIEEDKWNLTLGNPTKNIIYSLGAVNSGQHLGLWKELTNLEIKNKISQIELAQKLRNTVKYFLRGEKSYSYFLKRSNKQIKTLATKRCQIGVAITSKSTETKKK